VEPIAVHDQPAQEWIEARDEFLHASRHPRQHPASANVDHVGMRIARTHEKLCDARTIPRGEPVEQRKRHGCTFVGETAEVRRSGFELGNQRAMARLLQRRPVAGGEGHSDLFEPDAHCRVAAAKARRSNDVSRGEMSNNHFSSAPKINPSISSSARY